MSLANMDLKRNKDRKSKRDLRVLVACGGTGGHILPALSFLKKLKSQRKDLDIIITVTKRKIESQIIPQEYRVVNINLSAFRYSFRTKEAFRSREKIKRKLVVPVDGKNIMALVRLLTGTMQSIYIILTFRPDIVIGFGSYTTFALVFFAHMLGIKTMIHEQNVIPGISNKLLARFADRIAISFDVTREYLKPFRKKIILTGNPKSQDMLKVDRKEALDFFGLSRDKFTILVMGGSQGSAKINNTFIESLLGMEDKNGLQVVHLSGGQDFDNLLNDYKRIDVPFKLFQFLEPMHYAYCAADLVITRAGATTIGEIIFFGLPAIIVPYPFAYQHQIANAQLIAHSKAAILIEDSVLNADSLRNIIIDLSKNRSKINSMREEYKHLQIAAVYQQDLSDATMAFLG